MNKARMDTVVAAPSMRGDDDEDTQLLQALLQEATDYISHFDWCKSVLERYYGLGVGGVVGVFLFRIRPAPGADEWLWVVCGDLPSAYLVTDDAPDPVSALEVYCGLMNDWIAAVRSGGDLSSVFPVPVNPSAENVSMLEARVQFLRNEIIPAFKVEADE